MLLNKRVHQVLYIKKNSVMISVSDKDASIRACSAERGGCFGHQGNGDYHTKTKTSSYQARAVEGLIKQNRKRCTAAFPFKSLKAVFSS